MIPIFKAEKEDNIAHLVKAQSSISYACQIQPSQLNQSRVNRCLEQILSKADKQQFDLYYLDTILVTSGININLDIFTREELWPARSSAEDKPFNYGHNQKDIIGHITSSYAVDEKYQSLDDDLGVDELPDKFHLLTSAVIYRVLENAEDQKRIDKIIAEIEEGKWFVSMEALFTNFDYGLIDPDGKQKVIARNEETAGLTKHLRQYGGTGKYNEYIIGRVLKNITFCGKGLVENPANPESIIINNVETFTGTKADLVYINVSQNVTKTNQEFSMAENELNDKVTKLESDLVSANSSKDTLVKQVEDLTVALAARDTEIATLKSEKIELAAAIAKSEKDIKTSARIKAFTDVKAPLDEATKLVEDLDVLSDEAFAKVVDVSKDKWAPKSVAIETTSEEVLEDVEVDKTSATNLNSTDNKTENDRVTLSELLSKNIFGQNK